MKNIETLSQAASYLKHEFTNEIQNHAQFSNAEVAQLADIIITVFSNFEEETNRDIEVSPETDDEAAITFDC